jgi:hypothetical protein
MMHACHKTAACAVTYMFNVRTGITYRNALIQRASLQATVHTVMHA